MRGVIAAAEPAAHSALGPGLTLTVAAGAVAVLLLLIVFLKLQPMIALLAVSIATALVLGIPLDEVMSTLNDGLGGTLAEVALIVGFGAMLGRMLEISGGASVLAEALVRRFGERRAPLALGIAALLFGFPIFLDAGVVIFLPIVFTVARRLGGSVLRYALPVVGAFAVMHAFVPPHPGPVSAAGLIGANTGLLLLIGLVVGIPTWLIAGYAFGLWNGSRVFLPVPENSTASGQDTAPDKPRPSMGAVIGLLLLPLVLIFLRTGLNTLVSEDVVDSKSQLVQAAILIGQSPVALAVAVLVASVVLGLKRGMRGKEIENELTASLSTIAAVILITGAGGMFGAVLAKAGVGNALAEGLNSAGIPLIVAAFLIAVVMRVAQGSATVALTTSAGFIAPAVSAASGLTSIDLCLIVIAIASGATVLSHVNDSGFWLVGRLLGMDVPTTLKTWTVMETLIGVVGFLIAWALSIFL
ncbi:gluconate:H+ symporter, GntP family [Actinopolyspora mzabensis]|uniref:Gluconate:H+ symporter, GntP family n=1 Tax=Actinopolyspora mzabensis TaxID=995066 RepID=A0A1G9AUG2_ACTMZ|nr:gluconate:H+ symporter [Actinopolyspora mzabensis]SDK30544.1 gluconate:H+ symporter, GntP family [Actinopolyspora mzabensis]